MLSFIEHVHRHTENMAPWFPANSAPSPAEHETFDVHTCAEQHLIMVTAIQAHTHKIAENNNVLADVH